VHSEHSDTFDPVPTSPQPNTPASRPTRRLWAVAVGVGLAALIGACGSSSSTPSKASYDSKANTLCASYDKQLQSLGSNLGQAKTTAAAEALLARAASEAEAGTKKLEALAPPAGEASALKQAFAFQEQEVADIKKIEQAVGQKSSAKANAALTDGNAASAKADKIFDAQGLTSCGSGSSA
jgi:ABC-type Fe2+-enterobactin transport system substrate-binding protein